KAPDAEKAAHYIKRTRREVMDIVERWSGEYKYRINTVLQDMVKRCDKLDLRVIHDDETMLPHMTACLTMMVINKLHSGGYHIAL
ncbi:MAG: hypothetical protein PVG18_06685, partial [Thioalkalispiraceae bacterium]